MKTKAELENEKLIIEHNRLRKKLGYKFMRTIWSSDASHTVKTDTIEKDNMRLVAMNKIYEESNSAPEANKKIEERKI